MAISLKVIVTERDGVASWLVGTVGEVVPSRRAPFRLGIGVFALAQAKGAGKLLVKGCDLLGGGHLMGDGSHCTHQIHRTGVGIAAG